jgi:hypothetical protein
VPEASPPNVRSLLFGPVLCTGLLVAMSFENRTYKHEKDFEPFHARAAAAVNAIPVVIGPWMGRNSGIGYDEERLLKPNAYRNITFSDTRASALTDLSRTVHLLVVQCRRANDMNNHWPPNCYPAMGYDLIGQATDHPRTWTIGETPIRGYEYRFEQRDGSRVTRQTVYNFMVLPQQGIQPDMKAISASAEDYQQRYYGAAQFQVVFAGALAEPGAQAERDSIFAELITPCLGVIRTLSEGVIEP